MNAPHSEFGPASERISNLEGLIASACDAAVDAGLRFEVRDDHPLEGYDIVARDYNPRLVTWVRDPKDFDQEVPVISHTKIYNHAVANRRGSGPRSLERVLFDAFTNLRHASVVSARVERYMLEPQSVYIRADRIGDLVADAEAGELLEFGLHPGRLGFSLLKSCAEEVYIHPAQNP